MKNYEKYAEEIRSYEGNAFCVDFVIPSMKMDLYMYGCTVIQVGLLLMVILRHGRMLN